MFGSSRSTSAAEREVGGKIRSLCVGGGELQTAAEEAEEAGEHVVKTASSVGWGILQAASAAE